MPRSVWVAACSLLLTGACQTEWRAGGVVTRTPAPQASASPLSPLPKDPKATGALGHLTIKVTGATSAWRQAMEAALTEDGFKVVGAVATTPDVVCELTVGDAKPEWDRSHDQYQDYYHLKAPVRVRILREGATLDQLETSVVVKYGMAHKGSDDLFYSDGDGSPSPRWFGLVMRALVDSKPVHELAAQLYKEGDTRTDVAQNPAAPTPTATPTPPTTALFVAGSPQPTAYAIVIGIEKYASLPSPTGARADAEGIADVLRRSFGLSADHIRIALDERATKGTVERHLEWAVATVPTAGRLYFYFAGHGAPDASSGSGYLVPADGDPGYLTSTGIPVSELVRRLSQSKAKEILVMLDSCFSGAGGRSVLPPGTRPLVRVKEDSPSAQLALFTAASGNQISGPAQGGQGGLFTQYVTQALRSGAADADGDGTITLEELSNWVRPRVARAAQQDNRAQTPSLIVGSGLGAQTFLVEWGLPTK